MEQSPIPSGVSIRSTAPRLLGRVGWGLRFRLRTSGVEAATRLLVWGLATAVSAFVGGLGDALAGSERGTRRAERRRRRVLHLVKILGVLKGPFAKLGQFASVRYDALTAQEREALSELQDRVPALPLSQVTAQLEAELGAPLDAHFRDFEAEPIGAASIAQVHRATTRSGEPVVVKVQYPWLEASLASDLRLVGWIFRVWSRWGGRRHRHAGRLFDEFAAGVREEIDFDQEARAAAEIGRNLATESQIVVPRVYPTLSTQRVLTMTYHPAIPILDRDRQKRAGIEPAAVLHVLARAYAKQVFVDGLFHADPHPGNLFVVDEPEASRKPRVLFVDFGLCKRLAPDLQREMRVGIFALLQNDLEAFIGAMQRMEMVEPGAEASVRTALSAMFERVRSDGSPLAMQGQQILALKDVAKQLLLDTEGIALPIDLLLYAKTLSYLFGLGALLDPEVDLMKISVPYLLQFLAKRDEIDGAVN